MGELGVTLLRTSRGPPTTVPRSDGKLKRRNASQSVLFTVEDAGTIYWVLYDAEYAVDEPFLTQHLQEHGCKDENGIIIISHLHEDHRGALFEKTGSSRYAPSSYTALKAPVFSTVGFSELEDEAFDIPGLGPFSFTVLSRKPLRSQTADDNYSLIVHMEAGGLKILLPGDCGLVKPFKALSEVYDVVVLPHHASTLKRSMVKELNSLSDNPLFIACNGSLRYGAGYLPIGLKLHETIEYLSANREKFTLLATDVAVPVRELQNNAPLIPENYSKSGEAIGKLFQQHQQLFTLEDQPFRTLYRIDGSWCEFEKPRSALEAALEDLSKPTAPLSARAAFEAAKKVHTVRCERVLLTGSLSQAELCLVAALHSDDITELKTLATFSEKVEGMTVCEALVKMREKAVRACCNAIEKIAWSDDRGKAMETEFADIFATDKQTT